VVGEPIGELRPDLAAELVIWRPILAGKVTIGECRRGEVSLLDLAKLNAMLDMAQAAEQREADRLSQKTGRTHHSGTRA
jgi:hypothetical protein